MMRKHKKTRSIAASGSPPPATVSDLPAPQILRGAWVTSHAGHLQMIGVVQDPWAPPQSAGYDWRDETVANAKETLFAQREGYFHTAAVTYYVFDGAGKVSGHTEHVRGGYKQHQSVDFSGTYEAWLSTLGWGSELYWGRIYTISPAVSWNYYFAMSSDDTMEWVWTPPVPAVPPADRNDQPRPLVARGTLTRVRYAHRSRATVARDR